MYFNTKNRASEIELMDDFLLNNKELLLSLDKIATINTLLGGNKITLNGIYKLIKNHNIKNKKITILDIGCGNGDMLRFLSKTLIKKNNTINFIGIDANQATITYAKKLSLDYCNITFYTLDVFSKEFETLEYDIALLTLTLHHFDNHQIANLISKLYHKVTVGIVVNDIHRSIMAYYLFYLVCLVFNLNNMSKKDGLLSIKKGFKKNELKNICKENNLKFYSVKWRWAFRYELIIQKLWM